MYFRPAILSNGMWDQVRVDCGKEFYLCLFMQEILSAYRYNTAREPYKQTQVFIFMTHVYFLNLHLLSHIFIFYVYKMVDCTIVI